MKCATTTQFQSARTYRKKTAASTTNKSVGTFQGMCHSKGGRWFAPCYHKLSQTKDAKQHSCNKTILPLSEPVHTYQDHGICCDFIFVHSAAYLSHKVSTVNRLPNLILEIRLLLQTSFCHSKVQGPFINEVINEAKCG